MILQPPYILDANTFMEAARTYYQFKFGKQYWDKLISFAEKGKVISIDKVLGEIKKGNKTDALVQWSENDFLPHFASTETSEVVQSYADVIGWAASQNQYNQRAKDVFMEDSNADAWVVAYAKAHNCSVITHELPRPSKQNIIPIPNICTALGIPVGNTFEMLAQLDFNF